MQTFLRVKASSLERLSLVCPHLPMPSKLPNSHILNGGSGPKKKPRRQEAASSASADAEEGEGMAEESSEPEEDVQAVIPSGFEELEWEEGQPVLHFMLWTSLDNRRPSWHPGVTVRQLGKSRRDGFTHDAKLDGTSDVRGVKLTSALYSEGSWVRMAPSDQGTSRAARGAKSKR